MTRFAAWPRWAAVLLVGVMAALVLAAAARPGVAADPPAVVAAGDSDIDLYRAVAARVGRGEDYYAVAAAEHRARDYPMAPAAVVREPTQALLLAAVPQPVAWALLLALAGGALFALWRALDVAGVSARGRLWGLVPLAGGVATAGVPTAIYMHEMWAALLIALSLAVRRPDRWLLPLALGLAACLFRELAAPYLLAMAACALLERRWREAAGWAVGLAVFAGLFAAHLALVAAQQRAGDVASPGWLGLGGWSFVVATARWDAYLASPPAWLVAAAICLSLLGLVGRRDPLAARAGLILAGYLAAFAVVGRHDNVYWGLLYAPILPLGIVFAPAALRDLARVLVAGRPAMTPSAQQA